MSIKQNIISIQASIPANVQLIAVTKLKPVADLMQAYDAGFKVFGENYVQELVDKEAIMPKDIVWHLIGHLQTNKVKYIAPFVALIQSVDSFKLLKEINKQAAKNERIIDCLLQIYIAKEDSKTGMAVDELNEILSSEEFKAMQNIKITGLMGMASFTADNEQVISEFNFLKMTFEETKKRFSMKENLFLNDISMGMSGDYLMAIEAGSTMVRVGSAIFGNR